MRAPRRSASTQRSRARRRAPVRWPPPFSPRRVRRPSDRSVDAASDRRSPLPAGPAGQRLPRAAGGGADRGRGPRLRRPTSRTHLRRLWVARDKARLGQRELHHRRHRGPRGRRRGGHRGVHRRGHRALAALRRHPRAAPPRRGAQALPALASRRRSLRRATPPSAHELAGIESWMTSAYGKGKYCPPNGSPLSSISRPRKARAPSRACTSTSCRRVLAKSRKLDELVEAWRGWHAIAAPDEEPSTRATSSSRTRARARSASPTWARCGARATT